MYPLILVTTFLVATETTAKQSPFLKEMVTGRCYERPPDGLDAEASCPSVVGSIMGVVESHLDQDIDQESFGTYLASADFSSSPDSAVFWPPSASTTSSIQLAPGHDGLVSVETTPGGALMKDLRFCGVDMHQDCPAASGASQAFWKAAYAEFAGGVQGRVRAVVDEGSAMEQLLEGGIPNLVSDRIKSFDIYSPNCGSSAVSQLQTALADIGIPSAECMEGGIPLVDMLVCEDPRDPACVCLISTGEDDTEKKSIAKEVHADEHSAVKEDEDSGPSAAAPKKSHATRRILGSAIILVVAAVLLNKSVRSNVFQYETISN